MEKLKMVFKVGARKIEAPMQNASLSENVRQLKGQFPCFRWTDILPEDGVVIGDEIVYELQLPPVKVNG